ncbi:MAG: diaminopimelate decarboxylase [Verrucomicrobiales bacterium]
MSHDPTLLHSLAEKVGTPFWLFDAGLLRQRIRDVKRLASSLGMQARYAMKACPATRVLEEIAAAGIWIDAVSGNEVLRALRAGFVGGTAPPVLCFTADVFRDNALKVLIEHDILPNLGSPGMLAELTSAGYSGPISLRVNPGFGHGHVNSCDTGGPSSKHGIWLEELSAARDAAEGCGMKVAMLHAHIGSGPQFEELCGNLDRLTDGFAELLPQFPTVEAVSLGGGIPHHYREPAPELPAERLRDLFAESRQRLCAAAGRELRLEIEPGRYYVAPACTLVARVRDLKQTQTNEKGPGTTFAMIDAGFVDLIRPAMYGSYHRIEIVGSEAEAEPIVVAGPICESGDVFTRDEAEFLRPRMLPRPRAGDLLTIHDAGAYGYSMSSNYNSIGRAPQLWLDEDGSVEMISRRENVDDLLKAEVRVKL